MDDDHICTDIEYLDDTIMYQEQLQVLEIEKLQVEERTFYTDIEYLNSNENITGNDVEYIMFVNEISQYPESK